MISYFIMITLAFTLGDITSHPHSNLIQRILHLLVYSVTFSVLGIFGSVLTQFWLWITVSLVSAIPNAPARYALNVVCVAVVPTLFVGTWLYRVIKICRYGAEGAGVFSVAEDEDPAFDYSSIYIDGEEDERKGGHCSICLEGFTEGLEGGEEGEGGVVGKLRCGHVFHKGERSAARGPVGVCALLLLINSSHPLFVFVPAHSAY